MPSGEISIPNGFLLFLLPGFVEVLFNDGFDFDVVLGILVGEDYVWEVFVGYEDYFRLMLYACHCLNSIRYNSAFYITSELAFLNTEDLTFSQDWYFDILHGWISLNLELLF